MVHGMTAGLLRLTRLIKPRLTPPRLSPFLVQIITQVEIGTDDLASALLC